MKIVVMCGGLSMERNVSISSGTLICKALRAQGHQAVLVDMFFGLENNDIPLDQIFDHLPPLEEAQVGSEIPDLDAVRKSRKWSSRSMIGQGVFELCQLADVVFLGLHGACGEDGRIQATLDLLGVPYTGSGYLGSALAMDKDLTKQLVAQVGVLTPKWSKISYSKADIPTVIPTIELPCVIKPVDSGSSIGVSIAHTKEALEAALVENLKLGCVMIEQFIQGREVSVGVLNNKSLPPIEIIPKEGFYDYKNKYQAGATLEICPAPLDSRTESLLGEAALKVHTTLGLSTYSRSDFIIDAKGDLYFLEVNTLPGMTPTSLIPQEAAQAGIQYNTLCRMIIDGAVRDVK